MTQQNQPNQPVPPVPTQQVPATPHNTSPQSPVPPQTSVVPPIIPPVIQAQQPQHAPSQSNFWRNYGRDTSIAIGLGASIIALTCLGGCVGFLAYLHNTSLPIQTQQRRDAMQTLNGRMPESSQLESIALLPLPEPVQRPIPQQFPIAPIIPQDYSLIQPTAPPITLPTIPSLEINPSSAAINSRVEASVLRADLEKIRAAEARAYATNTVLGAKTDALNAEITILEYHLNAARFEVVQSHLEKSGLRKQLMNVKGELLRSAGTNVMLESQLKKTHQQHAEMRKELRLYQDDEKRETVWKADELEEAQIVHTLLSYFPRMPEFPLVSGVVAGKQVLLDEVHYVQSGMIANNIQLGRIADVIALIYSPAAVHTNAFESWVAGARLPPQFRERFEKNLEQPSKFDTLAQFLYAYQQQPEGVIFRDYEGNTRFIASREQTKKLTHPEKRNGRNE
ncbi:hypothetical protein HYZ97_00945 [Candidatus Pacearchaeota archaeon]|nr:hypothetical protein [Candidatus Pacearchaeota archaeon]